MNFTKPVQKAQTSGKYLLPNINVSPFKSKAPVSLIVSVIDYC